MMYWHYQWTFVIGLPAAEYTSVLKFWQCFYHFEIDNTVQCNQWRIE